MNTLLLEIVESTEAAAMAAAQYIGSGDKKMIDKTATEAMVRRLSEVHMNGKIIIGEGKKDDSFGLFIGDWVGAYANKTADDDYHEIAVDPVDGTSQVAKDGFEAMSVIAVGKKGSMLATEDFYMNKIAVGSKVADVYRPSIKEPLEIVVGKIKTILNKKRITVCMLDRPRHAELAARVRALGCRVKLIQDCDVAGAIATALPGSSIDLFLGIGGSPEGVIAAAALKCLGGYFEGLIVDHKEYKPLDDKVYIDEELAKGDVMFAATGITDGSLLEGIRYEGDRIVANSIIMDCERGRFKRIWSDYRA